MNFFQVSILLIAVCAVYGETIKCHVCTDCATNDAVSTACSADVNETSEYVCMAYAYTYESAENVTETKFNKGCLEGGFPASKEDGKCYTMAESGLPTADYDEGAVGNVCYCEGDDCNDWKKADIDNDDIGGAAMATSSLLLVVTAYLFTQ